MKSSIRFLLIPLLSLCLLLGGCAVKSETFTKGGVSITLTNRFSEFEQEGYTAAYADKNSVVLISKEKFEDLKSSNIDSSDPLSDYADLVISANKLEGVSVQIKEDMTYFHYQGTADNEQYSYVAFILKDSTGFWMIQFGCKTKEYAELESSYFEYYKSVVIAE